MWLKSSMKKLFFYVLYSFITKCNTQSSQRRELCYRRAPLHSFEGPQQLNVTAETKTRTKQMRFLTQMMISYLKSPIKKLASLWWTVFRVKLEEGWKDLCINPFCVQNNNEWTGQKPMKATFHPPHISTDQSPRSGSDR